MGTEFNLEKALAGKAVVHEKGIEVVKIDTYGEYIVCLLKGEDRPCIYESEKHASKSLRMAEEVPVYRIVFYGLKGYVKFTSPFNDHRTLYDDFSAVGVCFRVA